MFDIGSLIPGYARNLSDNEYKKLKNTVLEVIKYEDQKRGIQDE